MSPNDPGCVKTDTSEKCRKYNSPTRLRAARGQYDLTSAMRNLAEALLVRVALGSFHTAKTRSGHAGFFQGYTSGDEF